MMESDRWECDKHSDTDSRTPMSWGLVSVAAVVVRALAWSGWAALPVARTDSS